MAIFRQDPPNEGVECTCGRQKLQFSANIWRHSVLSMVRLPSAVTADLLVFTTQ